MAQPSNQLPDYQESICSQCVAIENLTEQALVQGAGEKDTEIPLQSRVQSN
jgi:hypothetical protein